MDDVKGETAKRFLFLFACSVAWAINKVCAKKKQTNKTNKVKADGQPTFPDLKPVRGVCEDGLLQVADGRELLEPIDRVCAKKKKKKKIMQRLTFPLVMPSCSVNVRGVKVARQIFSTTVSVKKKVNLPLN